MTVPAAPVIAFLGTGSLNGALLRGLLAAGTEPARLRATTRSEASARALREDLVRAAGERETPGEQGTPGEVRVLSVEQDPAANRQAAARADVVVLGAKPKDLLDLAADLAPALAPETVVVSVAAGITLDMLEQELPAGQPVVRTMPNTPAAAGRGVISVTPGRAASPDQLGRVREILSVAGTVVQVPEELVGAVTGVSGSGPAYAFYLAEALQRAGQALGLDAETARVLAKETLAGAGALLQPEDADPAALRRAVTSPNGTTEKALEVFAEGGLVELTERAVRASAERSREMESELRR